MLILMSFILYNQRQTIRRTLEYFSILLTSSISVVLTNFCKKILGTCIVVYMYVHSFGLRKCDEPEALLKKSCWLPCFKSVNYIYRFWDMSCIHLLCCRNFIKITSLEKKKILYGFSASNTVSLYRIL